MLAVRFAGYIALTDEIIEREGSITTASIVFADGALADLTCLEGVHAGETNALTTDLDRIAVDHRGLADNRICSACWQQDRHR